MDSTTCNLLIGDAESSPVCRSSEGKNQGKPSSILLTSSSVRSAVYRSLLKRKRGRKPLESDLFFYVLEGAANACCTRDLHSSKQTPANTFSGGNGCPKPIPLSYFQVLSNHQHFFSPFSLMPQCVKEKNWCYLEGGERFTSGLFQASRNKSALCSGDMQI